MANTQIRAFEAGDYDNALALWQRTPGMGLSSADERPQILAFLERNPGLSFIAQDDEAGLIGTVLCGSDGRRGYLYHLAVDPQHRRAGIGTALATAGLAALRKSGIEKCHLMVIVGNDLGANFWRRSGWVLREDILLFSKSL